MLHCGMDLTVLGCWKDFWRWDLFVKYQAYGPPCRSMSKNIITKIVLMIKPAIANPLPFSLFFFILTKETTPKIMEGTVNQKDI